MASSDQFGLVATLHRAHLEPNDHNSNSIQNNISWDSMIHTANRSHQNSYLIVSLESMFPLDQEVPLLINQTQWNRWVQQDLRPLKPTALMK